MSEAKPTPAIGYSILANIGDDRQVTFQHFVGEDESDEAANAAIDRIMRIIDRQKAIRRIPDLVKERNQVEGQLTQFARDLAAVEADYAAREEARKKLILELQVKRKETYDAGYAEHATSGRRGSYEPAGRRASMISTLDTDISKQLEEALHEANAREQATQGLNANNEMRRVRLAQIAEEIDALEKQIGT